MNQRPPGYSFLGSLAGYDCAQLRGEDSNLRPPGYEPDELPLLYPAAVKLALVTLSEPQLYTTHRGASRIKKNLLAVKVHQPADPIIRLANT